MSYRCLYSRIRYLFYVNVTLGYSPVIIKTISDDDLSDADCILKIKKANLEKLIAGKLDPMLAFTMGKLKIKGSMGVAAKLSSMLD